VEERLMKIRLLADRTYTRTEHVRWRGKRAGTVMSFEAQPGQPPYAIVEVPDKVVEAMDRTYATRFILDRGNMVEIYELKRKASEEG
jgi:hypothetical protein